MSGVLEFTSFTKIEQVDDTTDNITITQLLNLSGYHYLLTLGLRCAGRGLGMFGKLTDQESAGSWDESMQMSPRATTQISELVRFVFASTVNTSLCQSKCQLIFDSSRSVA